MRFNQVFAALMILALASGFVISARFTNPARVQIQSIFSPVSRPANLLIGMVYRRFPHENLQEDRRVPAEVLQDNLRLQVTVENLTLKVEELNQLNEDRKLAGDLRGLCKPMAVAGVDPSGLRESLLLGAPLATGLKVDMPVICNVGVVGRVVRAGVTGGQVRLITDPGFTVAARIGQFRKDADGQLQFSTIENLQPLVQGIGHGAMTVSTNLPYDQVMQLGISVNDSVLLDDRDWPPNLRGYRLGKITAIGRKPSAPLLAEIRIEPSADLLRLREVMVMVK